MELNRDEMIETVEAVYSNLDHNLNEAVKKELIDNNKYAQHAAWDFCGYVYFNGIDWVEQVWVFGSVREEIKDKCLNNLIATVNNKYGNN